MYSEYRQQIRLIEWEVRVQLDMNDIKFWNQQSHQTAFMQNTINLVMTISAFHQWVGDNVSLFLYGQIRSIILF